MLTAKREARKRRANERHRVGCYAELGCGIWRLNKLQEFFWRKANIFDDFAKEIR
jgi:hypothetical protein